MSVIEVDPGVSLEARSVVAIENSRVVDIIEKPAAHQRISNVSSLPLYVFSRSMFVEISQLEPSLRGEFEIPSALRSVIQEGQHVGFAVASQRIDLTDQRDLLAINEHYLSRMVPAIQVHRSVVVPSSALLVAPVLIEEGVAIGSHAVIGPFVCLERNSSVAQGSSVRRSVVTRGSRVQGDVDQAVIVGR
jgi:dTDP-glucose pyrophosphorylase